MSMLQKVVSVTFASIVLVMAVLLIFTLSGVIEPDVGSNIMENIVEGEFFKVLLYLVAIVLIIFSIREIAFGEKVERDGKDGIILENESGKLIISKESLENLIAGVGREVDGVEGINSRTSIDIDKNVTVDINVVVNREVVIKELSKELQKKAKEALKQTVDLDVKYVNIRVKNISNKKSKKSTSTSNNTTNNTEEKKENGKKVSSK